jgi:hypothetical protein
VANLSGLVGPFAYGPAYPQWLPVTTPAAGATATVTVDGKWNLRPLAARLSLTTDANVANRLVTIDYVDARGNTWLQNGAGLVVTANTTAQTFEFDAHRTVAEWAANTPVFAPLAPFFLPPGFRVKFNVLNIQATDAISGLSLWFETFQGDDFRADPRNPPSA